VGGRAGLVVCPEARIYDHGPEHPLRPQRVLFTWDLIEACGLLTAPNVSVLSCKVAEDEELGLVHSDNYIDATRRAGDGEAGDWWRYGYGPGDNPIFPRMHQAGALVAGASLEAARAILEGRAEHAFNAAGGLHHAMPSRASGFCVYDDPAIAIAWLLRQGVHPIAYVDVDVHHGDGVQAIFYEDPRVLTCSVHESGRFLFPGTGWLAERGTGAGEGTSLNIPLPAFSGDGPYLRAVEEVIAPAVRRFRPQVVVTQNGADPHHADPLAHLQVTMPTFPRLYRALRDIAWDAAGGKWLALGGGGYTFDVVPRAWAMLFATMLDVELPEELPPAWLAMAKVRIGQDLTPLLHADTEPEAPAEQRERADAEAAGVVDAAKALVSG